MLEFYELATQFMQIRWEKFVISDGLSFARSRPLTTGHQMVLGMLSDTEVLHANPHTYVVYHV